MMARGIVEVRIADSKAVIQAMEKAEERISELESTLRAVDAALENEFGGFYLSAPEGDPMGDIREMLRGER
jgi:hypothetical protein